MFLLLNVINHNENQLLITNIFHKQCTLKNSLYITFSHVLFCIVITSMPLTIYIKYIVKIVKHFICISSSSILTNYISKGTSICDIIIKNIRRMWEINSKVKCHNIIMIIYMRILNYIIYSLYLVHNRNSLYHHHN